ncbi:uncharacterized protein STEHIDRAFT_169379 [Stereum hirsutum FP-91666 SS1]|uniref:uncharacterized protein n=1 Tax=Stereum hirsutum (strain FP-91666) TaxID=721885 RepID=UPI0004449EA7|nr:uncharacterized protein STEHIDRAFT_169379 [Stereum hirsutum FP-91666 SS1]EIM85469.1 hypothetical protein STEHIDRAFT_169379 [Stereum hirsutum FP-91666 SS1]
MAFKMPTDKEVRRQRMKPDERTWLDDCIRNGPSSNDGSARSAWKRVTVDAFLSQFMSPDDGHCDDRRKRMTKRVNEYIKNHTHRVLGIHAQPRRTVKRPIVPSSPTPSLSSSSLDKRRARSFRDIFVSSDPHVQSRAKVLGRLVKDGAISRSLSLSLWAKFINWRMEGDDVLKMRDAWERGELETEQISAMLARPAAGEDTGRGSTDSTSSTQACTSTAIETSAITDNSSAVLEDAEDFLGFHNLSLMESLPFWPLDGHTLDPSELDRIDFGRDESATYGSVLW